MASAGSPAATMLVFPAPLPAGLQAPRVTRSQQHSRLADLPAKAHFFKKPILVPGRAKQKLQLDTGRRQSSEQRQASLPELPLRSGRRSRPPPRRSAAPRCQLSRGHSPSPPAFRERPSRALLRAAGELESRPHPPRRRRSRGGGAGGTRAAVFWLKGSSLPRPSEAPATFPLGIVCQNVLATAPLCRFSARHLQPPVPPLRPPPSRARPPAQLSPLLSPRPAPPEGPWVLPAPFTTKMLASPAGRAGTSITLCTSTPRQHLPPPPPPKAGGVQARGCKAKRLAKLRGGKGRREGGRETFTNRGVMPRHGAGLESDGPGQRAATAQLCHCSEQMPRKGTSNGSGWGSCGGAWQGHRGSAARAQPLWVPGKGGQAQPHGLRRFGCLLGLSLADPSACATKPSPWPLCMGGGDHRIPPAPGALTAALADRQPQERPLRLPQAYGAIPAAWVHPKGRFLPMTWPIQIPLHPRSAAGLLGLKHSTSSKGLLPMCSPSPAQLLACRSHAIV